MEGGKVTYILIVVFSSYGFFNKGLSVSEMQTKKACETAAKAVKDMGISSVKRVECIEVKP
jgi:hypothetical protein